MDEKTLEQKYVDFIDDLVGQVGPLLPPDVNELQKNYLITNMKKSATLFAKSMDDAIEFKELDFERQCFFIQILAEWSFHKEIDLFRSGIPAKYWKTVMNKIWYTAWEVMYACVKNDAPDTVVLSLVERFVNRTYNYAIEELKETKVIDEEIEEKAKEQSNIDKMAQEMYKSNKISAIKNTVKSVIIKTALAVIISIIVTFVILKFKIIGLSVIVSLLVVYNLVPLGSRQ